MKRRADCNTSRRTFVKAGLATAAVVGLGSVGTGRPARAEELPRLEESNPQAQALQYVHDASTVDVAKRGSEDNICATCNFYTAAEGSEWGPCQLFPGKAVAAAGWCAGFVAKPS